MTKIINISDKLSTAKPVIQIGEKQYEVNDSMDTVLKFEELAAKGTSDSLTEAIEISLGAEAVNELNIRSMSLGNYKIMTIAILASMQGVEYDEIEARFPKN